MKACFGGSYLLLSNDEHVFKFLVFFGVPIIV